MALKQEFIPLTFEKGLNTFDAASVLEPGECVSLENFEWIPNGGLTPRPAWKAAGASPTGAPASKRGRGIYTNWYESGVRKLVQGFYDNGTAYTFYKTNVANPTTFASYTAIETGLAVSATYRDYPVSFAAGLNVLMYTNPGFPSAQVRTYDGATVTAVATNDIAGRCLSYYLNRFWTGGAIVNPTYLRFCEIGDPTNWNVLENFIPVGQDDGEPIEEIVAWENLLVIGKQHSLWYMSGNDLESFALKPLGTIGAAKGRSIIPSAAGVFIIGIDANVYLWDGGSVRNISTMVDAPRMPTTGYMTAAYVADKLLVAASHAGDVVSVYDPAKGRWRKESVATTTDGPQDLASYDDEYLVASTVNGSRALSVRLESGAFATGTYRDPTPDTAMAQTFLAQSGQIYPKGPFGKATLKGVYIRYHQWFGQVGEGLTVTPVVDGTPVASQAKILGQNAAAGVYVKRLDFGANLSGNNFGLKFSGANSASEDDTYAIEECVAVVLMDEDRR